MGRMRRIVTGWRVFFLACVAVLLFGVIDERHALSGTAQGFYPPQTYCMISAWDFPKAWSELLRSDALKRMAEDWPRPHKELELAVRLGTGVRPTPVRWRFWLGHRTVFAFAPEGIGITAFPGHALRWADALRRALGYVPDADGIGQYRGFFYTWRNGYLVASSSRDYVSAAKSQAGAPRLHSDSEALLTVQWEGEHPGFADLMPGAGLRVSGQVAFACADGGRPITLPQAWPSTSLVTVSARSTDDIERAWTALDSALARVDVYAALRQHILVPASLWNLHAPSPEWVQNVDHVSIALLDIEAKETMPVPVLAFAMRYADSAPEADPFSSIFQSRQKVPFEWNGNAGYMAPLLGTAISPCVARTQREWMLTTNGPAMSEVAGHLADGPACAGEVDVALRASWEKIGDALEAVVLQLGEAEALPRMNANDVRAVVLPKIKALSKLGRIALDGVAREGTLKFSGHLAKPVEGGAP